MQFSKLARVLVIGVRGSVERYLRECVEGENQVCASAAQERHLAVDRTPVDQVVYCSNVNRPRCSEDRPPVRYTRREHHQVVWWCD